MTESELINAVYDKLKQTHEHQKAAKSITEWVDIDNINYEECKSLCEQNGFTFYSIWDKAVSKMANDIIPNCPRYIYS